MEAGSECMCGEKGQEEVVGTTGNEQRPNIFFFLMAPAVGWGGVRAPGWRSQLTVPLLIWARVMILES